MQEPIARQDMHKASHAHGINKGQKHSHSRRERRDGDRDERADEFVDKLVSINRVAKVVKGGRRFGFAALVVVGDQKGRVGFGHGKAREVPEAIRKATEAAKRDVISVPLRDGRTLHHDIPGRHGAGKVLLRSAPPGTGIIAGGPMRAVFETLGVHDVVAKSIGSSNPYNMVRATFDALQRQVHPKQIAAARGIALATLNARKTAGIGKSDAPKLDNLRGDSNPFAPGKEKVNTRIAPIQPQVKVEERFDAQHASIAEFHEVSADKLKALDVASAMLLNANKRSDRLVGKSTTQTRAHLVHVARHIVNAVFSTNNQEAGRAAYYLVVHSDGYGSGLDPQARFDSLSPEQAKTFLSDLRELLRQQGINFITRLTAKAGEKNAAGELNVEIGVTVSRALSFEVNGSKVLLGNGDLLEISEDLFEVGCPIAKKRTSIEFFDGDGADTLFGAKANFLIPEEQVGSAVPCIVSSPIGTATRKVQLIQG